MNGEKFLIYKWMRVVLPSAVMLVVSGIHRYPNAQDVYQRESCAGVSWCCALLFSVTKALGPKQFQLPFRPPEDLLARAMTQGPKTVDVPASLPTPPHNNQEELR